MRCEGTETGLHCCPAWGGESSLCRVLQGRGQERREERRREEKRGEERRGEERRSREELEEGGLMEITRMLEGR